MTDDVRPILDWDDMSDFKDMCVYKTRLDGRYQLEAHRHEDDQDSATLYIWDHREGDRLIHSQDTGHMMAGAIFGPDVDDVARWQEIAISVVDNL